jgi:sugar phosphate isomerase/epimerase
MLVELVFKNSDFLQKYKGLDELEDLLEDLGVDVAGVGTSDSFSNIDLEIELEEIADFTKLCMTKYKEILPVSTQMRIHFEDYLEEKVIT